jgi:16S rRNA (guanine(966)-N(2))-methyltransferase RsmD
MGTLRVISGSAKGARLKTVPGQTTRPITDQVKEALFNILGSKIQGTTWLDLFAGTGAVGIEAISRDAEYVTFIEINHHALTIIKENLQITHFEAYAEVLKRDAFELIAHAPLKHYDYIYIAPPQYRQMWQKAMNLLDENPSWLAEEGEIVVQINPIEWQVQNYSNFQEIEQRKYGDTMLIFFQKINRS